MFVYFIQSYMNMIIGNFSVINNTVKYSEPLKEIKTFNIKS